MPILEGKHILVTGVLTDSSIAYAIAQLAQEEGAEVILSGAGRGLSLTKRTAKKLAKPAEVLEIDVTVPEQLKSAATVVERLFGKLDGIVHAIAYAPPDCLGGNILKASWESVATTLHVSTYSLKALAESFQSLLKAAGSSSVVGLDFDASAAWPAYDWMGVAKASLESLTRYLARDLGAQQTRVNLIAAGPLRTIAAKSVPGFDQFEEVWRTRSPLDWRITDATPVAKACVALLSDWFPMTTGEIIHVDGGFHAMAI
ncbi:MAG: enoyl-ACP reductase FabI [Actinobacteria bacterium]|jgi:enoyl-[acyl-carrier protein] reductase I|nr:enoyl-ACP reductase FabI [Actinomycetota bacterium]MCL6095950.1 enoyl-ACP reductase FabI [Actinomycetota bacterium]